MNKNRAFLISGQVFGQHILDHNLQKSTLGYEVGMPDFKDNFIGTLLIKGWYKNDRLSPQILAAYDVRAQAAVVGPSVDWLITDKWRLVAAANFKFGTGEREFDDNRSAAPFTALGGPAPSTGSLRGTIPFGRFRSGPIGMASNEDEIQLSLRYRF